MKQPPLACVQVLPTSSERPAATAPSATGGPTCCFMSPFRSPLPELWAACSLWAGQFSSPIKPSPFSGDRTPMSRCTGRDGEGVLLGSRSAANKVATSAGEAAESRNSSLPSDRRVGSCQFVQVNHRRLASFIKPGLLHGEHAARCRLSSSCNASSRSLPNSCKLWNHRLRDCLHLFCPLNTHERSLLCPFPGISDFLSVRNLTEIPSSIERLVHWWSFTLCRLLPTKPEKLLTDAGSQQHAKVRTGDLYWPNGRLRAVY